MLQARAVLAALILIAATGARARADDRAVAREHYYKGTKAFELGLYDEAIGEYMAAYKAKDDPALLYNIAQSHRLAGHAAEALRFYKVYLKKLPNSSNSADVEHKIEELEKLVEQQKHATHELPPDQVKPLGSTPTPDAAPKPEVAPTPAPMVDESHRATTGEPDTSPDRNAGRTMKIAGLTVAAVGVAALAAGIALEVLAKRTSDELTALDRSGGVYDPAKHDAGKTDDLAGGVLLGVGGAAAVAGVVVAVIGFRRAKPAPVALRPVLSPTTAGAVMLVRF
jgi:tetratricopeptide (TPR) repeat protein